MLGHNYPPKNRRILEKESDPSLRCGCVLAVEAGEKNWYLSKKNHNKPSVSYLFSLHFGSPFFFLLHCNSVIYIVYPVEEREREREREREAQSDELYESHLLNSQRSSRSNSCRWGEIIGPLLFFGVTASVTTCVCVRVCVCVCLPPDRI